MHKDPVGKQVLEAAANAVKTKKPISFVASTDADYRDFYRRAPASLR